ncbi:MAG: class C sortase [Oscillospiraceae bacterium]|nr:class C sortase [Oscillospiraceae bacterium]
MKKKSGASTTIILILILIVGLSLLLYPTVSNYWNSFHQSRAIATYTQQVSQLTEEDYSQLWEDARDYNRALAGKDGYYLSEEQQSRYDALLDITGSGIMGYVDIPAIKCSLPIYHGTGESVLQVAAGHLDWTSLPVGGETSHCVISGHRGLPSAKLFTDLDRLALGDFFTLRVLDEVLTYQVDQILVVLPNEMEALTIEDGADYCTMVTCTPYGINSHRLLVRGHRVDNSLLPTTIHVPSDAVLIDPLVVAPIVAVPMLLVLLLILLLPKRRRLSSGGDDLAI